MLSFAASAATAVATAQTVAAERLRHSIEASEHERGRWARELHDETLQGLGAIRVLLASALTRGDGLEQAVKAAVAQVKEEIDKLRSLITELRPAALDEIGLAAAIEVLADDVSAAHGIEMNASVELAPRDEPERLDPDLENTVYRVVQEALNNVAKHARAEEVRLRVADSDGRIEIEVADDGTGFDPRETHRGFGLLGMRERLATASGRLEIESVPGEGTTLRAVVPADRPRGDG